MHVNMFGKAIGSDGQKYFGSAGLFDGSFGISGIQNGSVFNFLQQKQDPGMRKFMLCSKTKANYYWKRCKAGQDVPHDAWKDPEAKNVVWTYGCLMD